MDETTPRTRRAVIAGAVGGTAALAVAALGHPEVVRAGVDGDVVLGEMNTSGTSTIVRVTTPGEYAVQGQASATTGTSIGVAGSSKSPAGVGVYGYIESATGIREGARTGLAAVTVAGLFLACLFLSPLAGSVPAYATAPALFYVACLMLRDLTELDWEDITEVIPASVTALMMPFTYSIANGVAFGFISYAGLKLLTGRAREVKWIVWLIAAVFVFKYVYQGAAG